MGLGEGEWEEYGVREERGRENGGGEVSYMAGCGPWIVDMGGRGGAGSDGKF